MMRITKISVTRIAGMFLIFATHLFLGFYGSSLGYVFNVGVPLFFIISGYLYGKKGNKRTCNLVFQTFYKDMRSDVYLCPSCLALLLYKIRRKVPLWLYSELARSELCFC